MAQVSYGTITITDTNDIEEIYTIYAGSSGDTQQDMPTWTYAAVTGGTIWKRDASLVTGDYIWQSIVITKSGVTINATNWEDFYNTPICITGPEGQGGQPGTPGKGISNITIQYCNYGSGEPANTGSHWQDTIPTYDSSKPNYWTKTTITYTVGDPFIKKVLDQGITDAVYNSVMANSIASNANENAQGALSQVTEVEQHLSVTDTNISALQSRLKKIWINENTQGDYVAGTYAASGIDGTIFATDDPSTFGYNTLLRHNQLALRYNTFNLTQLSTAALTFYRPTTINNQLVQGDRGLVINADGLDILSISNYKLSDDTTIDPTKIYYSKNNNIYTRISIPSGNPHTNNYYEHDIDAKLDANGLILKKGGIQAGTAGQSGFIYLSTEDYPLKDEANNIEGITINEWTPSVTGTREGQLSNDPAWRQVIGTKFGVDSEGNVYAAGGQIGGWHIGMDTNRSLYYENQVPGATTTNLVISSGSEVNTNSIAGSDVNENWFLSAGQKFGVTTDGTLYANNANIRGTIYVGNDVSSLDNAVRIGTNGIVLGNIRGFHIFMDAQDPTSNTYGLGFYETDHRPYVSTKDETIVQNKNYYQAGSDIRAYDLIDIDAYRAEHPEDLNPNPYSLGWYEEDTSNRDRRIAYINNNELSIPYTVVLKGMKLSEQWVWELNESTKNLTLKWIERV